MGGKAGHCLPELLGQSSSKMSSLCSQLPDPRGKNEAQGPRVPWPLRGACYGWGGEEWWENECSEPGWHRGPPTPAFQPLWPWEQIWGLVPRGYWVERFCEEKHWTLG